MRRSWLIKNGDYLLPTERGRPEMVAAGVDAAMADRIRELTTPQGSAATVALDTDGRVVILDEGYGNPVYQYKSMAIDSLPIDHLVEEYRRILSVDPLLTVESVTPDPSLAAEGVLRLLINLKAPDGTMREMAVDLDGTMLTLS